MSQANDWSGEERRQERRRILERRREARDIERLDRANAEQSPADNNGRDRKRGPDRRAGDRRREQICFVCRDPFVPTSPAQTICATCQIDGVRGGGRSGWRAPRF